MSDSPGAQQSSLERWLLRVWYGEAAGATLLLPLSALFRLVSAARRWAYARGVLPSTGIARPVVVVGNVTVGGTGKTPLVIWLACRLRAAGLRPGIVLRGYRRAGEPAAERVGEDDATRYGDEAVVLRRRTGCPVVVGADRVAACRELQGDALDVILSDDGLQHYRLRRDVEIAVVDGARGFGNGHCLPAGPLREPAGRLGAVDAVVVNGEWRVRAARPAGALTMRVGGAEAVNMSSGERRALHEFAGGEVHAAAGIGNPGRFFAMLRGEGLRVREHAFADHAYLERGALSFDDDLPVLLTEKDAVKYQPHADLRHWVVPVEAGFDEAEAAHLVKLVHDAIESHEARPDGQTTA